MRDFLKNLVFLKMKFSVASLIATAVDLILFEIFNEFFGIEPVTANVMALSIAILVNFYLQKRYVFELNRKLSHTFLIAIAVSISGIFISSGIIYVLCQYSPFNAYPILAKLVATGTLFLYNFYLKRFAFEKKIL